MSLPRAFEIPAGQPESQAGIAPHVVTLYDDNVVQVHGSGEGLRGLSPAETELLTVLSLTRYAGVVTVSTLCELDLQGEAGDTENNPLESFSAPLKGLVAKMTLASGARLIVPQLVAGEVSEMGFRLVDTVQFIDDESRREPPSSVHPLGRKVLDLVRNSSNDTNKAIGTPGYDSEVLTRARYAQSVLSSLRRALYDDRYFARGANQYGPLKGTAERTASVRDSYSPDPGTALYDVLADRNCLIKLIDGCERLDSNGIAHADLIAVVSQFAHDVARLQAQGVYRPKAVAFHHGPAVVATVRQACLNEYGIAAPSAPLQVIDRYIANPVEAVRRLAERRTEFRTEIEPRLRKEFDYTGKWTDNFLWHMLTSNADTETYLRHWFKQRRIVLDAYPTARVSAVDAMMSKIESRPRVLEMASREPERIDISGEAMTVGRLGLVRVRLARLGGTAPKAGRVSWEAHELARQIRHNKHLYDGLELNEIKVANFFYSAVKHFNTSVAAEQRITFCPNMLIPMFAAFVEDVRQFKQLVAPGYAAQLASIMSPSEYCRLEMQYCITAGLAPSVVQDCIRKHPRNPEGALQELWGQTQNSGVVRSKI